MSEQLAQLYAVHLKRLFPPRLRTTDVAGVWFVMLDADIAACTRVVLDRGSLDSGRAAVLARQRADLELMLPLLTDPEEVAYANGLRELAARCAGAPRSFSVER